MKKPFITLDDFKYRDRFVDLNEAQFMKALQAINAEFSGVYTLWAFLPPREARAKRELCINLLIAWKLAMWYPESDLDGSGTGALPISSKHAGSISIAYRNLVNQDESILSLLTTNAYGSEALMMIQSAPEMYLVFA